MEVYNVPKGPEIGKLINEIKELQQTGQLLDKVDVEDWLENEKGKKNK